MFTDFNSFNNKKGKVSEKNYTVYGLDILTKNLEKNFFADVTIQSSPVSSSSIDLVINLDCNFTLEETVANLNNNIWGNFVQRKSSLFNSFNLILENNAIDIDIEEFSIFLKDTSIIIKKIYNKSIPEQLEDILNTLSKHHLFFTKGCTESPYEIYIPVFEEEIFVENQLIAQKETQNFDAKNYNEFWGIYFESEEDALIYDLKQTNCIPADLNLQMINNNQ